MDVYEYFSNRDKWFKTKTPNAAITGVKKGFLPKESFISLSLFLYSVLGSPGKLKLLSNSEEEQRVEELERILSKKHIDLETEVMLINTLDKLVEHKNPEIALFAAESINSIENRYNKRIYELKDSISKDYIYKDIHELITLLYRYGSINPEKKDILKFYYNEALKYFSLINTSKIDLSLYIIKIKILSELGNYSTAKKTLEELDSSIISDCEKTLLQMELEFKALNFTKVLNIINTSTLKNIPRKYDELVNQWKI